MKIKTYVSHGFTTDVKIGGVISLKEATSSKADDKDVRNQVYNDGWVCDFDLDNNIAITYNIKGEEL